MKKVMGKMFGLALICGLVLTSCQNPAGGGNDGNSDETEQEDIYYVKYEVIGEGYFDITYAYIKTEYSDMVHFMWNSSPWEMVIGPVKKGFNAGITVGHNIDMHIEQRIFARIYISKNGSPFVIKKNDDSSYRRNSVNISYTIDY